MSKHVWDKELQFSMQATLPCFKEGWRIILVAQLEVYTTCIPGIYWLLGGYMQVLPEAKDFIDLEGKNPTYKWLVYIYSSNSYANFAPSVRMSPHRPPSDIYCWVGWHRYEQPRRCFRNPTLRTSGVCCWIIQESLWQVLHTTIAMVLCLNFNYQQLQSSYLFIILRPPPKKSGKQSFVSCFEVTYITTTWRENKSSLIFRPWARTVIPGFSLNCQGADGAHLIHRIAWIWIIDTASSDGITINFIKGMIP